MNRAVLFNPAPVEDGLAALIALCRAALQEQPVEDDTTVKAAMQSLVTLLEDCNAMRRRRRAASEPVALAIDIVPTQDVTMSEGGGSDHP